MSTKQRAIRFGIAMLGITWTLSVTATEFDGSEVLAIGMIGAWLPFVFFVR